MLGMPLLKFGVLGVPLNFPWGAGSLTLETEVLEALWGCWEPPLEIGVLRAPFDPWGAGSATLKIEGAGDPIFFQKVLGTPVLKLGCSGSPSVFHEVLGVSPLKLGCWVPLSCPWHAQTPPF